MQPEMRQEVVRWSLTGLDLVQFSLIIFFSPHLSFLYVCKQLQKKISAEALECFYRWGHFVGYERSAGRTFQELVPWPVQDQHQK